MPCLAPGDSTFDFARAETGLLWSVGLRKKKAIWDSDCQVSLSLSTLIHRHRQDPWNSQTALIEVIRISCNSCDTRTAVASSYGIRPARYGQSNDISRRAVAWLELGSTHPSLPCLPEYYSALPGGMSYGILASFQQREETAWLGAEIGRGPINKY